MELQIFKDLSDNSNEILEFKRILSHSFHLDYSSYYSQLLSNFTCDFTTECSSLDELFRICDKICNPLLKNRGNLDFFGFNCNSFQHSHENIFEDEDFLQTSIKYHCIIASLYTLLHYEATQKDDTIQKDISAYSLVTEHLKKGYFAAQNTESDASLKETVGNYLKKFKTFYNETLEPEEQSLLKWEKKGDVHYFLSSDTNFVTRLFASRSEYKKIRKHYLSPDNATIRIFFKDLETFVTNFYEGSSNNVTDQILLTYETERRYNFYMLSELINTINELNSKKRGPNISSIAVDTLSTCFYLPNVFSRNLFLRHALFSYQNDYLNQSWSKKQDVTTAIRIVSSTVPELNRPALWQDAYQKFCIFFAFLVFPVYEKCFLALLSDIKKEKQFSYKTIVPLFNKYIQKNSEDILNGRFNSADLSIQFPKITGENIKSREKDLDFLLSHILQSSPCIFHEPAIPKFDVDYFGITYSDCNNNSIHYNDTKRYRKELMNVYIDSSIEYFSRIISIKPN